MNKVLVCPVAFNENVKLENAIRRFLKSPVYGQVDYLIVDDASDDGTTEMIQNYRGRDVQTIRHPKRSGVGAAIRTAVTYARSHGYDVIVIMAGNDKDNPDEIERLMDPILNGGHDFVQGSRYKGHSGIGGDMPYYRKIATRLHPLLLSLITGRMITDSTNGFRAMRLSIFDNPKINLNQEWLNQYELEPYIFYKVLKRGYKVLEVPVTKIYPSRKLGYTKMKPVTGWWSILRPLILLGLGLKK